MFEKLSQESIKIVMSAQEEAKFLNNNEVEPEHILLGILKESNSSASKLLYEKGITYDNLLKKLEYEENNNIKIQRFGIQFSHNTNLSIELALNEANKLGSELINPEHLLLGIISLGEGLVISILKDYGINLNRIKWQLLRLNKNDEISIPNILLLTSDITSKMINNEINTVIVREKYVEEIIYSINSYKKIYPLIIGEKGVGKTSIIYSFVQYLLDGNIFKELQSFKVLYFNLNNLQMKICKMNDIYTAFKEFTPKGFRPKKIKYYNVLYENDIINVICFSYYKHTSNLRFILSYYVYGKKFLIDYQEYNTLEFYKAILKMIKGNSKYVEELG